METIGKYIKIAAVIAVIAGGIIGLIFSLANNSAKKQAQIDAAKRISIPTVKTSEVLSTPATRTITLSGLLRANQELTLLSETDGKVTQVFFDLNQEVNEGTELARTYAEVKEIQVEVAKINFEKAKRDFERFDALFKEKNLSEYDLENARLQMENAEQSLKLAKQALKFSIVRSPIKGTITQKFIDKGVVLGIGSPVALILDVSVLKLFLNISVKDMGLVRAGDSVKVYIPVRDESILGIVKSISIQSTLSGTYPIEVVINNDTRRPLLAGLDALATFEKQLKTNALLIPRLAVENGKVFVVQNSIAVQKQVVVGKEYGESIEILKGLSLGEEVVVKGQNTIEDGQRIQVVNELIE
jgi:RND family efflux transporter MFP subunit